jgi:heterodisulfide reductase subunit B
MTIYEDVALQLNRDILDTAAAAGANVIVTTCPLCQINLEAFQARINRRFGTDHRMPIVYFTQLLGVALGFSPAEMQLDRLMVPVAASLLETREVRV